MTTIKNTNDAYGDPIEITATTVGDAVAEMQVAIRQCGPEFSDIVVTVADYAIVPDDETSSKTRCPACGKINWYADDDGHVDGPREYHAECWMDLADDMRDSE